MLYIFNCKNPVNGLEYGHGADLLKIKTGGAESILVDANGHVTMPKQSAFMAYVSIAISNLVQFKQGKCVI